MDTHRREGEIDPGSNAGSGHGLVSNLLIPDYLL
jgi:hypothetical protein